VVACAEPGNTHQAVAAWIGVSAMTVSKWHRRFAKQGVQGLLDATGSAI